jgi:hypothetical protein
MATAKKPRTERLHCNECAHETKHLCLASRTCDGSEDLSPSFSVDWRTVYDLFECAGCESVTLRSTYTFSEWDHGTSEVRYYPPRSSRRLPTWYRKLPPQTIELLLEVYTALHADSRRLAMMGARALIDLVILDTVGDVGTFIEKLNKLTAEGYVSKRNRNVLEAALDVGNAASHRGHKPTSEHVQQVMDIVENLLQTRVLEPVAEDLKNATPPKPSRKKS